MSHDCHAIGCRRSVPPKMLFCAPHWKLTPKPVQNLVWATYRPGQEVSKDPSAIYLVVQSYAVAAVALRESRFTVEEATAHIFDRVKLVEHRGVDVDRIRAVLKRLDPDDRAFYCATHLEAA